MTLTCLLLAVLITFTSPPDLPADPGLDVKIGQMLKIGFRGMNLEESTHIVRDLKKYHLGAVVLFDYDVPAGRAERNVESPDQLKRLISELREQSELPLLVTIDQEGGRVARLKPRDGFPATRSAAEIGAINHPDSTARYAGIIASTLAEMGIDVNLAPVVDVNINPENPIIGGIGRSFSAEPEEVVRHARITVETHRRHQVLTTLKHFPGHGSSREDSHLGMVDVTGMWSERELIPWQQLIDSGHADMVMTAHIFNEAWDSDVPATLSEHVINGMLRSELGFDGVVFSDDMQMDAIREHYGLETAIEKAILAGVDILGFANNSVYDEDIVPQAHGIIRRLVDEGRISEARIDASWQRIRKLKEQISQ